MNLRPAEQMSLQPSHRKRRVSGCLAAVGASYVFVQWTKRAAGGGLTEQACKASLHRLHGDVA